MTFGNFVKARELRDFKKVGRGKDSVQRIARSKLWSRSWSQKLWSRDGLWRLNLWDPRSGRTPKWGFGVAMLPVGALCFYEAHFGCTVLPKWPFWVHLFYSIFYSASEFGRACFRQARVAWATLPPGALFRAGAFAFLPWAPKSHLHPLPHFGPSDKWSSRGDRKVRVIQLLPMVGQNLVPNSPEKKAAVASTHPHTGKDRRVETQSLDALIARRNRSDFESKKICETRIAYHQRNHNSESPVKMLKLPCAMKLLYS